MGIEVGDVTNVITLGFHPISQWEFPEQKLTRTGREGRVQNLAILSVRAIETYLNIGSPVPLFLAVVVKRVVVRPPVVSCPGRVGSLEQEIRPTVIAYDENNVTKLL